MPRRYANPPVVEAICEFHLPPEPPWDLTVPGLFYERVREDFPHRERRMVQDIEFVQTPQGLEQRIHTGERLLLFSHDRKRLIQLGMRLLVINVLRPYPGWAEFKELIQQVWEALKAVVEVQGVTRMALRYINRVELPSSTASLETYFAFYPHIGHQLPNTITSFIMGVEFAFAEGRDRCRVHMAQAADDKRSIMLDLNYYLARPGAVPLPEVLSWMEEAHTRVEEVFEGCITDALRALFEERGQ